MYNAERFIGNCLDSVLQQNIPKNGYEILVMDDGSTDGCAKIAQDYATNNRTIKLFVKANEGAYATRTKLLEFAQGDYVYYLDADDYIVCNALHQLLTIAQKYDLECIAFDTLETTELDNFNLPNEDFKRNVTIETGKEFIEKQTYYRQEIWWYLIKKSFLKKHNLVFANYEYNADVVFTLHILLKCVRFVYLPIKIHRYVQTEDSLMRSKNLRVTVNRINHLHIMVLDKTSLIKTIDKNNNKRLVSNLNHRRDVFAFFNIINIIRLQFPLSYLKQNIKELKNENIYPLRQFIASKYDTFPYKILVGIINSETLLYSIVRLKNIVFKTKKFNE